MLPLEHTAASVPDDARGGSVADGHHTNRQRSGFTPLNKAVCGAAAVSVNEPNCPRGSLFVARAMNTRINFTHRRKNLPLPPFPPFSNCGPRDLFIAFGERECEEKGK